MSSSSIPPGGLILVTGANGYVASVAIQVFLQRGYCVRGTVRSLASNAWMKTYFGPKFELVEVPDIYAPDAFQRSLKGVDGVAHIAMNMDMNPRNHAIIEQTVQSNLQLLEAAALEPSIKSVVITSSLAACALPTTGTPYRIDSTTWNTAAIEQTSQPWNSEDNPRLYGIMLYGASKARIVPTVNFGTAVSPENMSYRSTSAVLDAIAKGYPAAPSVLPSQWYVDVEDTALLLLGALTLEDVRNERLLAFAGRYTWSQILEILHRRYPRQIMFKPIDESVVDAGEVDNERSIEVLKKMGKQGGFTSLEDTLVKALDTIFENQSKNVPKTRIDLYYQSIAGNAADDS